MKKILCSLAMLAALQGVAQTNINTDLLGNYPYTELAEFSDLSTQTLLNDIWGYVDEDGREYALVGAREGFSVVDVSDASNPNPMFFIPGPYSTWRDIKTWGHYAYVTHDNWSAGSPQGLLIVDLSDMTGETYTEYHPDLPEGTLNRAHNIYIDEKGVIYLFGADVSGTPMFNAAGEDPMAPEYLGSFTDYYLHDGMAYDDILWGSAIYEGIFSAIDVSDKSNPVVIGSHETPSVFTHNCWISDDGNTLFTTDEVSDGYIGAYDVSDLENISELDRIQSSPGQGVIPHNAHVLGNYVVNSYYRDGLQVLDATRPHNLIEVAKYDTSTDFVGGGFNGAWGAYPYLPSGNVLITDMEKGLFIFDVDYKQGCYLEGNVTDAVTGENLDNVFITIEGHDQIEKTNIMGAYAAGVADAGTYTVTYIKTGYNDEVVELALDNGELIIEDIEMTAWGVSVAENDILENLRISPNPSNGVFRMNLDSNHEGLQVQVHNFSGKLIESYDLNTSVLEFGENYAQGVYFVNISQNGNSLITKKLVKY